MKAHTQISMDPEMQWRAHARAVELGISFAERFAITHVASFDHHFAVYRYGPKRDRAFQIVR